MIKSSESIQSIICCKTCSLCWQKYFLIQLYKRSLWGKREKNLFFEVSCFISRLYLLREREKKNFLSFRQFIQSFVGFISTLCCFFLKKMMSFRRLIQSLVGFISTLCFFLGKGRVHFFAFVKLFGCF